VDSENLEATLAGLAAQGIEPERPPYRVGGENGTLICFVRDPDGYRIEIVERAA
jgi:lactoylglutathione lyase